MIDVQKFCVLVVAGLCMAAAAVAAPPNVVFFAVDDMNDWIGPHRTTPVAITPNIDRLAARGVNFTNAHTAGVYCAPSRSAMFTGQFASTTGCYKTQVYHANHPRLRPLQVSFAEKGYKTYGTGKLFHHTEGQADQRGWTEFHLRTNAQRTSGWPLSSWGQDTPIPQPHPSGVYAQKVKYLKSGFMEWGRIPNGRESQMADTRRTEWAVSKLKEKHDQPFFLALGLYSPHFPNYCPAKYWDLYDKTKIPLPAYKADDLDDLPPNIRRQKTNRSKIHKNLERIGAIPDALHAYLACISYADAMLGRVLKALEESPYADNTIVIFWSDHGYHHGEKGDWGKHTLWERTSNVPFIWAGPDIAQGMSTDATVSLIDTYPTLAELCNLAAPGHKLEGTSLAAVLKDPANAKDRSVYLPFMEPGAYAIINRQWRYIHYADKTEELYRVDKDPNEWFNLAGKPGHRAQIDALKAHAPATFAQPGYIHNKHKELVIEGNSFHWKKRR